MFYRKTLHDWYPVLRGQVVERGSMRGCVRASERVQRGMRACERLGESVKGYESV